MREFLRVEEDETVTEHDDLEGAIEQEPNKLDYRKGKVAIYQREKNYNQDIPLDMNQYEEFRDVFLPYLVASEPKEELVLAGYNGQGITIEKKEITFKGYHEMVHAIIEERKDRDSGLYKIVHLET